MKAVDIPKLVNEQFSKPLLAFADKFCLQPRTTFGKSHSLLQYALIDRLNRQFQVKLLKLDYLAV